MGDAEEKEGLSGQLERFFAACAEEKANNKKANKAAAQRRRRANKAARKRAGSESSVASDTGQSNDGEVDAIGHTDARLHEHYDIDDADNEGPDRLAHHAVGYHTAQYAPDNYPHRQERYEGSFFAQGGNYGALRKIPNVSKAQMQDLKSSPAHAIMCCEAAAILVDWMRKPPSEVSEENVCCNSKGTPRPFWQWLCVTPVEVAFSNMIAVRTSHFRSLEMLSWTKTLDGTYIAKKKTT